MQIITKMLPIFILMSIGFLAKRKNLFSEAFIEGIKKLIVMIALPAVLFDAFSTMTLQPSYLLLFLAVFLYCVLLYGIGSGLHKAFPDMFPRMYTKGYMTGFEFGMIGVGLFGAIWGMDRLPVIMLIGFGHELFIWFFYVLSISKTGESRVRLTETVVLFLKTPTIVAILLGVVANLTGLRALMDATAIGQSLLAAVGFLKPLTSPLILIVIGYTMVFHRTHLRETAIYIITRTGFVIGLGVLTLFVIGHLVPGLDPLFPTAFYAFILLPAPYILPLYIKDEEESGFFTQLLVYSTVVSLIGYVVLLGVSL